MGPLRTVRARTPKQGSHPRQQLLVGEGLGEVVVRAAVQPPHALRHVAERGQHEDRRGPLGAQAPADGEPVQDRHHHVENDEIGAELRRQRDGRVTLVGDVDGIALGPQHALQRRRHGGVIVDHEYPRRCHDLLIPTPGL